MASDPTELPLTQNPIIMPTETKISKAVKYYHLHREEIIERRRLKKMEDPVYKARLEERLCKKTEREEAEAKKRAEKEAAKAAKEEQKKKALQEKREAKRVAILNAYAAKEEARKKALEEKREAKRAAVLAAYNANLRPPGEI
jgi:membrane protein involved in colicin uptake